MWREGGGCDVASLHVHVLCRGKPACVVSWQACMCMLCRGKPAWPVSPPLSVKEEESRE